MEKDPPEARLSSNSADVHLLLGKLLIDQQSKKPKCAFFGGIPYAQPPVDELRFRKPRPLPDNFNYHNYGGEPAHSGLYDKPCNPCYQAPLTFSTVDRQQQTEDCLRLNVWIPLRDEGEEAPEAGWPILFYLHGGFLQAGSPSAVDPSNLIAPSRLGGSLRCIVVVPGYRLGVLGFLASREVCGQTGERSANFGLWDQRIALEWTAKHIVAFGGDAQNITIAGLSAGAYSAFLQLVYDLRQPSEYRLIRRILQCSNGCGVQPKAVSSMQEQFQDLMQALGVHNPNGSAVLALNALREKQANELVAVVPKLKQKFFRPVTDGAFVKDDLLESLANGTIAAQMSARGIQVMIGNVAAEAKLYATVYPPTSFKQLVDRLTWDYPQDVANEACRPYKGDWKLERGWQSTFGKLYAMMQVYATTRGQIDSLISKGLPISNIFRYRIDFRSDSSQQPKSMGATHSTDLAIWLVGNGQALPTAEQQLVKRWLAPLASFVNGEAVQWGTKLIQDVRVLTVDGEVKVERDPQWNESLEFWRIVQNADQAR